tara:strand:+ start:65 stop:547 length:483 start_codon:yes stop_codon:yes gene_type:complete
MHGTLAFGVMCGDSGHKLSTNCTKFTVARPTTNQVVFVLSRRVVLLAPGALDHDSNLVTHIIAVSTILHVVLKIWNIAHFSIPSKQCFRVKQITVGSNFTFAIGGWFGIKMFVPHSCDVGVARVTKFTTTQATHLVATGGFTHGSFARWTLLGHFFYLRQ